MKYYKGKFSPKNPGKYKGNPTNIIYRSLWELKVMKYLDSHPNVLTWQSEEIVIAYQSPVDKKIHRYFPDFVVRLQDREGKIKTLMLEVKPDKQTRMPDTKPRRTKKYIAEVATYAVNEAKWEAAKRFCEIRDWEFKVITEKHLGL